MIAADSVVPAGYRASWLGREYVPGTTDWMWKPHDGY